MADIRFVTKTVRAPETHETFNEMVVNAALNDHSGTDVISLDKIREIFNRYEATNPPEDDLKDARDFVTTSETVWASIDIPTDWDIDVLITP